MKNKITFLIGILISLVLMPSIYADDLCHWGSPLAHWNLTLGSNLSYAMVDCAGNAGASGFENYTFSTGGVPPIFGENGTTFDGTKSMNVFNYSFTVHANNDNYTICYNASFSNSGGAKQAALWKYVGADDTGWATYLDETNHPVTRVGSSANNAVTATPISLGVFYEICHVDNGTAISIYINGVYNTSTVNTNSAIPSSNQVLALAERGDAGGFNLYGTIRDATIYHYAMSSQNISDRYAKVWAGGGGVTPTGSLQINLLSPGDNNYSRNGIINFYYNDSVSSATIYNCSLWTNISGTWARNVTNTTYPININATNNFSGITINNDGKSIWNIGCNNGSQDIFYPANYTLNIKTPNISSIWMIPVDASPQQLFSPLVNGTTDDKHPQFNLTTNYASNCSLSYGSDATCTTSDGLNHYCYLVNFSGLPSGTDMINFTCNATQLNAYQTVYTNVSNDTILPNITLGPENLFISNAYIYNIKRENITINATFADLNLFQASVNVSCDINKSLFYWEILDINTTSYNYSTSLDISNQRIQRCNITFSDSDDHTAYNIPNYLIVRTTAGIYVEPGKTSNKMNISSKDADYSTTSYSKNKDRYNFDVYYDNKELTRTFKVITNHKIFYQANSEYPAHFVIWDDNSKTGTWLDFKEYEDRYDYTVSRINDYEYDVVINARIPVKGEELEPVTVGPLAFLGIGEKIIDPRELEKYYYGTDHLRFHSIGGTNIFNVSYTFWIGADVNFTSRNLYDNSSFTNWSANIYRPSDGWNRTVHSNSSGTVYVALSNDTYNILFYDDNSHFFNQTFNGLVITNGTTQFLGYNSSQSIINYMAQLVYFGGFITNFTIKEDDLFSSIVQSVYPTVPPYNTATFYVNSSNYTYLFFKDINYTNTTGAVHTNYLDNLTVIIQVPYSVLFRFYDEEKSGIVPFTPFNMSSVDSLRMMQFCENSTLTTVITTANQSIPIYCVFQKLKFVETYGAISIFRTLIYLNLSSSNEVYLISNPATTSYIYNSFILDDLFSEYANPSIWIKKRMPNGIVLIHADYTDIEGKVPAYLLTNNEYEMEIHSTNNPDFVVGKYSADITGDKIIKLWTVNLNSTSSKGTLASNNMFSNFGVTSINGSDFQWFSYNDLASQTINVTFMIYNQSTTTPWYTYSSTGSNAVDLFVNISSIAQNDVYARSIVHYRTGSEYDSLLRQEKWLNATITALKQNLYDGFGIDQNWLDMFFLFFLCTIALFATMVTADGAALLISGVFGLLVFIGWFGFGGNVGGATAIAVVGFTILLTLINLWNKGDRG